MLPEGWIVAGQQIESGQSWLYQVTRESGPDLFALKRLKNPKRAGRFAREVVTMGALRDRGVAVPEIVASDLECARPWFAMRWYPKGSLDDAVADGRFRADTSAGIETLRELASVLSGVHSADVAHRDLKPGNVLASDAGLAMADFGLCLGLAERDDGEGSERLTETLEAIGSRNYIAPENEAGFNPDQDQRPCDFYAFGKVAWALLAGRPALPRERELDPKNQLAAIADDPRLGALDRLLRELLNRDPRARLTDWDIVATELRAVEDQLRGKSPAAPAPPSDLVRIAQRLKDHPAVVETLSGADEETLHRDWLTELKHAMLGATSRVHPALQPLQAPVREFLEVSNTSGGYVSDAEFNAVGLPRSPAPPDGPAQLGVHIEGAAYMIHSTRQIKAFPTLILRAWPVTDGTNVWFISAPTVTPYGARERVAIFLCDAAYRVVGPLPSLRQTTVDEGVRLVEQLGDLFLSVVDHYMRAVEGDGLDPAGADTWSTANLPRLAGDPPSHPGDHWPGPPS